jgi:hypothetical protein
LVYRNLPHDLFTNSEAVYAGDKELHAAPGTKVTLSSLPATLRNLSIRGPPWGRYGQHTTLDGFLMEHCTQHPGIKPLCKHNETPFPPADLNAFLLEGLLSMEFQNPPSINRKAQHSRVFSPMEKLP